MKRFAFVLASALAIAGTAQAHGYKLGSLDIGHPWVRATPPGASVAGGYLKITNTGGEPDRLVGVSSPIAGRVEVHEVSTDNGVMKMRPLKDGLEIKPGETVELKPGSYHVMMLDLKTPVKEGDHVKGTLVFQKAGSVDVEFIATGVGSSPGEHGGHAGGAGGGMSGMSGMGGTGGSGGHSDMPGMKP